MKLRLEPDSFNDWEVALLQPLVDKGIDHISELANQPRVSIMLTHYDQPTDTLTVQSPRDY